MATKAEVRQRVGEDLGLVPIGQDIESQDQIRIDATYDETYARLKKEGLAAWASASEVPDSLVPYFCLLMEQRLLITYSVPESRYLRIMSDAGADGMLALAGIAKMAYTDYESLDGPADY